MSSSFLSITTPLNSFFILIRLSLYLKNSSSVLSNSKGQTNLFIPAFIFKLFLKIGSLELSSTLFFEIINSPSVLLVLKKLIKVPYGGFSPLNSKKGCFLPVLIFTHLVEILVGSRLSSFSFKNRKGEISSRIQILLP